VELSGVEYDGGVETIYLDNNATTRPLDEVIAAVDEAQRALWANPSSVHRLGQRVRQRVELARAQVAELIGAKPRELVFTSGGTESNNLALRGLLERSGAEKGVEKGVEKVSDTFLVRSGVEKVSDTFLVTTPVEHSAVREPAEALEALGVRVVRLPVDGGGRVRGEAVAAALDGVEGVGVVSVQWANNETGAIQPVSEIAAAVAAERDAARDAGRSLKLHLHLDATQAVGKLPVDVATAGADLLTLSAHKFHGPKGIGALWLRRGVRLQPQQRGGPQERERRGGTENTFGILGMGVAAEHALAFVNDADAVAAAIAVRDRFEAAVLAGVPDAVVNSADGPRLWNTSNLAFPGLEAEAILLGLSERGVCASAGAACSSGSLEPSPVLLAMGLSEPVAHGSVRFSTSRFTTADEVDRAAAVVTEVVGKLSAVMPVG